MNRVHFPYTTLFRSQNLPSAVIRVQICAPTRFFTPFTSMGSKLNVCHAPISNGLDSNTFRHWEMLKMSHSKPFILTTSCWNLFVVYSSCISRRSRGTNFRHESSPLSLHDALPISKLTKRCDQGTNMCANPFLHSIHINGV